MNRWNLSGIAFGIALLWGGSWLNSRVPLFDWAVDGPWWHFPLALCVFLAIVCGWIWLMTEGVMVNIYGREYRKGSSRS